MMEKIHILLVEDNEGDIVLTREAFEDSKILTKLSVVTDGQKAIDFISKSGDFINVETPDLLLLDINLPKKSGIEVLKFIKNSQEYKKIPVIMLTTSSSESDILSSYNNYANCFITKPVEMNDFLKAVTTIEAFWISLVKLPSEKHNK